MIATEVHDLIPHHGTGRHPSTDSTIGAGYSRVALDLWNYQVENGVGRSLLKRMSANRGYSTAWTQWSRWYRMDESGYLSCRNRQKGSR